jgi:hypothetical protein
MPYLARREARPVNEKIRNPAQGRRQWNGGKARSRRQSSCFGSADLLMAAQAARTPWIQGVVLHVASSSIQCKM